MLSTKNLDRTSLDSLSSAYLSDQSPDDLALLHRLNTLLSSNSLPRLTNILDVTPSLLIALYESLPPFQRVPLADATASSFTTRLRNMKLLAGSIASGRNGFLTEKMRQQLEELDLRKFCEKDAGTVRDAIEVIVDVGERGRQAGMSMAGPETPKGKRLRHKRTPRTVHIMERGTRNNAEGSPTPRKKRPVLVLPVTRKTENSEASTEDKDLGWGGSILKAFSQTNKVGHSKDWLTNTSDLSGTIMPDFPDPKPRKAAPAGHSFSAVPSPSSTCSSVPPGFLEHLSARVNAIVARCPAPPPYTKDLQGKNNEEGTSDTSRRQRLIRGNYPTTKLMPGRALVMEDVQRHNAKTGQFGGELRAPPAAGGLSSIEKGEKKPGGDFVLRDQKGTIRVARRGGNKVDREEEEKSSWVTEDESGIGTTLSFPSLVKKDMLDSTRRTSVPIKESGLDAEVAAHIPLPTSRPASTTSRNSKQGNDLPSKPPLPLPPSLLRTMHWATSLPTPPLSPNAQKVNSRLATPKNLSTSKPHSARLRRAVSTSLLPSAMQKKRAPVKRHGSAGLMDSFEGVDGIGSQGDGDEWVSVNSQERSPAKGLRQGTPLRLSQDDKKGTILSSTTPSLAPARKFSIITKNGSKDIYGHDYSDNDEHDDDGDYDYDDDKTSLYSASTVSWGEDDPFTAALRQKRQIALEKLQEMERSFNEEIETKKRTWMESREPSVNDRPRWRAFPDNESDETREMEGEGHSTDSEGGVTDVEEELRLLEEIGRRESVRQQLLLKRLMARGT